MIAADISFWTFTWYAFAGLVIGVLAKLFAGEAEHEYHRDDPARRGVRHHWCFLVECDLRGSGGCRVDRWGRGRGYPSLALFAVRTEGAAERMTLPS
jgi:hypothetical protein